MKFAKVFFSTALVALTLFGLSISMTYAQGPVGTAFTYQGRLTDGGSPANGAYDFSFNLYSVPSGGAALAAPNGKNDVTVTNGLFTVTLDFGSNVFNDQARYLDIWVRPGSSSGGYTALAPRQRLLPTPNALFSSAPWVTSGSNIHFAQGNVGIGTSVPNAVLSVVKSSSPEPSVQGFPAALKIGSPAGTIPFAIRQNAAENNSPTLVYFETSSGDLAYLSAATNTFVLGALAGKNLGLNVNGSTRAMTLEANGRVGIGTTSTCLTSTLHVVRNTSASGTCNPAAILVEGGSDNGLVAAGGNVGVWGNGGGAGVYGESVSGKGVQGISTNGIGIVAGSTHNQGLYASSALNTGIRAASGSGTFILEGFDSSPLPENRRFAVMTETGNVLADGAFSGPADFAEMMTVTGVKKDYTPGDVLVMGQEGKLARSTKPYSSALVGVYSAQPGFVGDTEITIRGIESYDGPLAADRLAVALLGIVPVKVTDENGAIQPGDLLTTSSLPGHAMKATPTLVNGIRIYPTGTILGKALTSLEQGSGVIQVLITSR
jgi:hypothetical protein